MTPAFIHVGLCDNDYGQQLEEATRLVYAKLFQFADRKVFQECVIQMTKTIDLLNNAAFGRVTDSLTSLYLDKSIVVIYSDTKPDADHDGGSVAIDCNTGYIWRY